MTERTTDERYQDSLTAYDVAVRAFAEAIISGDPKRIRLCASAQIAAVIERERALLNRVTHIVTSSQLIVEDLRDELKDFRANELRAFRVEIESLMIGMVNRLEALEADKDTPAGLLDTMVGE